jgi:hypothetical protein
MVRQRLCTKDKIAKERGWKPVGRIVSWVSPAWTPASQLVPSFVARRRSFGLKLEQIDRVEVNEAFASRIWRWKELGPIATRPT